MGKPDRLADFRVWIAGQVEQTRITVSINPFNQTVAQARLDTLLEVQRKLSVMADES